MHTYVQVVDDVPRLHVRTAADTTQACFRNSSVAGGGGIGKARDGAVELRQHRDYFPGPALGVQDVRIYPRRD